MEPLVRFLAAICAILANVVGTLLSWIVPRQQPTYPPIRNKLLILPLHEVITQLLSKKLTSEELVGAYIERIKEVNPCLNAVIEDRFEEALKEAQHADQLIAKASMEQLMVLFARYPLLGVPFTVKESCGVKGMSFVVGNAHRRRERSADNGATVELLRSAGAIPLAVSANPEFCLSLETNTEIHGVCRNPFDLRRTPAGSSGGEGALNGCGSSLFGVGSDIGGSIRLPAMFCGVFGHKPTGGLVSVDGHFPISSKDPNFRIFLQLGPISRFARDLPLLLQVMAGRNADKLKFSEVVETKDIKIHYAYGFDGSNGLLHGPLAFDIKMAMKKAVKCFEKGGLETREAKVRGFRNSFEISVAGLVSVHGVPSLISHSFITRPTRKVLILELIRSLFGHSLYSSEGLFVELMYTMNGLIPEAKMEHYRREGEELRRELINLLGTNGVLFFPTFHTSAFHHKTTVLHLAGLDYLLLFNILGLPSTHVPMGLDRNGMPIGFQVVAAPYQDKLCLQIAAELEGAFGGWVPPLPHEIQAE